jgi:predicted Zn finger-like uncharacterized protein
MQVQCSNCKTTYNVADSLINSDAPTFRCSRCRHTFVLEIKRESKVPKKGISLTVKNLHETEEERELSFPFIHIDNTPPRTEEEETIAPSGSLFNTDLNRQTGQEPEALAVGGGRSSSLPVTSGVETVSALTSKSDRPSAAVESEFEKSWWTTSKQSDEEQPVARLSTAPYLGLFTLLLGLYALLAFNHTSNPGQVEGWLRLVPGMAWAVFKNNHLKQGIAVQGITQKAQVIRGNREVFTIAGVVVNRNPVGVREVRIEGYIFNGDGKEIGRQTIFVGNPISANLIRDVEAKEILILQEIGPQKRFAIPPDESAPFLIVFLKSSKEIKSFAYRVVSAEEAG